VTKEERDRREAERKAKIAGAPDLGGVALPFSRSSLLRVFWVLALIFPAWTIWNARTDLNFETVFVGSVLYFICLVPSWFWVTARIQGLPIFPLFGLSFLPTYVVPLWHGHSMLAKYTDGEITAAAWTMAAFLLIALIFWQQSAVRNMGIPHAVRLIDLKKSEKILLICLLAEVVFEVLSLLFWQLGGGAFAAVRSFAGAAGRMAVFVFSYQLGQRKLQPAMKVFFLVLLAILIVQETATLMLANVIPTLGIAFTAYILGSGKIPWKAMSFALISISILHAGKYAMRENYLEKPRPSVAELPSFFTEWVGLGIQNLSPVNKSTKEPASVSTAKERAALIPTMALIMKNTPEPCPYLEGKSYDFIPSLLVPRIFSPTKGWAHTGNIILSLHYGILDFEGAMKTSIAFDPVMEAYANFGYLGVLILAVIMGFFIGGVTRLTIHVPMLSFGFLLGVQTVAVLISSFNTAGVFVTSMWQAFLALCGLSLVLMNKQNNPVWKYYALKLTEQLKFNKDAKNKKALEEALRIENEKNIKNGISDIVDNAAGSGMRHGAGNNQESVVSGHPSSISGGQSTDSVRHERPTRFVYGEKKK
jgi:hypothetical protein